MQSFIHYTNIYPAYQVILYLKKLTVHILEKPALKLDNIVFTGWQLYEKQKQLNKFSTKYTYKFQFE